MGDQHGLAWPLACDVVDLAAMRRLKMTGQEADGSSEGVGVFQEGRDISRNKVGEVGAEAQQDPPTTAHAPAPGAERRAPTPRGLVTSPEQHAGDGEVGETADASRHQLQLRFRHSRVQERDRAEQVKAGWSHACPGTRLGRPRWAWLYGRGVLREWSSTRVSK